MPSTEFGRSLAASYSVRCCPPGAGVLKQVTRYPPRRATCAGIWGVVRRSESMLVLSRRRDESIIIGDDVVITIVDIRGDKVRIAIEAPLAVPVHRKEVYEAIQREKLDRDEKQE